MVEINFSRLKFLDGFLILMIVAAGGYIFTALRSDYKNVSAWEVKKKSQDTLPSLGVEEKLRNPKAFDVYDQKFSERDIFSPAVIKNAQMVTQPTADQNTAPQVSLTHLKVVAIVLSKPREVVIEDTNLHQTLFLKEGETQGDLMIKKIEKGTVTVNFMGQQHELKTQVQ